MIIKSLLLEGFRNYDFIETEFSTNVNIIAGNNAQGKTNLLEAIFYLTGGRSFRTVNDRDLIKFDKESANISSIIYSGNREQKIEAKLARGKRKQLFINGVRQKTAAALSGKLTAVLFYPDDLNIIRAGASERRKLMDTALCQLRPRYAAAFSEFGRLYLQKTRILRDYHEKPSLLEALDEYNYRLAQMSAELIYYRAGFSQLLSEKSAEIHREFSGSADALKITYQTVKTIDNPLQKPEKLLPMLLEHQQSHKKAEIDSGLCLSGAHKDDLEVEINGTAARHFASQGQARTAALSIKLAEREIHFDDRGEYPVLLLDDVLSELDRSRQNFILNRINEGQVFITCCEDEHIAERTGGMVIHVEDGQISLLKGG